MKLNYRNIIALNLTLLILFSTIGFNIISTMCVGCDIQQTTVAISTTNQDIASECCNNEAPEKTCCKKEIDHKKEHHKTTSKLAQLKFDSPEARSKIVTIEVPVHVLFIICELLCFENSISKYPIKTTFNSSPPLSGRDILTLICILRN